MIIYMEIIVLMKWSLNNPISTEVIHELKVYNNNGLYGGLPWYHMYAE